MSWAELYKAAPWDTYLHRLPRRECSIQAYAKVIDEPEIRQGGLNATLRLTKLRSGDGWHDCRGKVLGVFATDASISYGDVLRLDGAILLFDESDLYGFYKKIYGIRRKCVVREVQKVSRDASAAMSIIYALKGKAARCLAADFKDKECAALYQAMILGMRSEMPSWSRNIFVRSSSIHLFSISGLHILFFSRFFEWLLTSLGLPRKQRLLILAPCMLIYVTMCGAAPSALRSYYMMLSMAFAYFRSRQHSMENGLALSGLLLLVFNPFYMMHIGFLYSFILVYCLLRGRVLFRETEAIATERQSLIPKRHGAMSWMRLQKSLFSLVSGGVVAWLGSVGIMMRSCGFIAFGAVVVNILLAPLASLLVFLAFPKVIAALFSGSLSAFLATCVELLLKTLVMASKAGGTGILCVACPKLEPTALLAYYLLLAVALSGSRPAVVRLMTLPALCAIVLASLPRTEIAPTLLAATGRNGLPPCLAVVDSNHGATIIQLGDASSSRRMLDRLKAMGCADRIYLRIRSIQEIRGAMQFPAESIKAVAIDRRIYESILSSKNYITKVIAHGTHLISVDNQTLNGMIVMQTGQTISVTLPHGWISIVNNETGMTQVTTSNGSRLEFTQSLCNSINAVSLSPKANQ